jgi:hypothetical protein
MVKLQALILRRVFEPSAVESPIITTVLCTATLWGCRLVLLDSVGDARTSDRLLGALVRVPLWTWLVVPAGSVLLEFVCELAPLWLARAAGLRAFGPRFSPFTGARASITYTIGVKRGARALIMLSRPGARLLVAGVAYAFLLDTGSGLVGCIALLGSLRSAGMLLALPRDRLVGDPATHARAYLRHDASNRIMPYVRDAMLFVSWVVAALSVVY